MGHRRAGPLNNRDKGWEGFAMNSDTDAASFAFLVTKQKTKKKEKEEK